MKNSSIPAFPQEICHHIIDYLFADKRTLKECSQVCKAWVPACRHHLFLEVWLRQGNWVLFRDVLHTYARKVLMRPENPAQDVLQSTFAGVTSLLLQRRSGWHEFPHSLASVFPRVKVLEIRDAFKTFYNIALMVSSFPELETLTLDFVSYQEAGDDPRHLCLPPKLKTLNLQGNAGDIVRVLEWFDSAEPPPKLSTVRILCLTERHMGRLSSFLSKLEGSLQRLYLTFYFDAGPLRLGDDVEAFTYLLTEAHTALQSLSLQAHPPEFYQHHLVTYLQNIQITEVTILANQSSLERHPTAWLSVDKLIVDCLTEYPRPNFILHAHIQRHPSTDIDQLARSAFPKCVELGIVNRVCESERLALTRKNPKGPVSSNSMDYIQP